MEVWAGNGVLVCWCGHQLNYNSTNVKEPLGYYVTRQDEIHISTFATYMQGLISDI